MIVDFNVRDFLDRAEAAYADRIGLIDEPDQVAAPWGPLTFAELAARARAQAAGLDRLGVGVGDRVAVVSQNSARLLTSFYGVCGWGRILVPVNFRLAPAEVEYIVEHSGASVLMIDPELEDQLSGIACAQRFVLGADSDDVLFPPAGRAPSLGLRRGGHRHHQLHLWDHRPPQGGPADPPQLLGQRRRLRMARPAVGPGRLPPHAAHVPRQRMGHALGHHRHGLYPAGAAQGRRRPRSSAGSSATA